MQDHAHLSYARITLEVVRGTEGARLQDHAHLSYARITLEVVLLKTLPIADGGYPSPYKRPIIRLRTRDTGRFWLAETSSSSFLPSFANNSPIRCSMPTRRLRSINLYDVPRRLRRLCLSTSSTVPMICLDLGNASISALHPSPVRSRYCRLPTFPSNPGTRITLISRRATPLR